MAAAARHRPAGVGLRAVLPLVAVHRALASAAGQHWVSYAGRNCYPGKGAESLAGRNPVPGHRDLPSCQRDCMQDSECDAVILEDTQNAYSSNCYLRRNIHIEQCEHKACMGVWIAPKDRASGLQHVQQGAWTSMPATNCWPGHGGDWVDGRDALPGHKYLAQCEEACVAAPECDGIVWHDFKDSTTSNCYLRANIDINQCVHDVAFNTRLRPSIVAPVLPTLAPTPAPTPAPEQLSLSDPTARPSFKMIDAGLPCCNAYSGAAAFGFGRVVFAPFYSRSVGVFEADGETFSKEDIKDQLPASSAGGLFRGVAAVGDRAVFAPFDAHVVGIFHTVTKVFSAYGVKAALDGDAKFAGAAAVGSKAVFAPYYSESVGVFDVDALLFTTVDISSQVSGKMKFNGAAALDSGKVVFAPYEANAVGVFDTYMREFSKVDIQTWISTGAKFAGATVVGSSKVVFAPSSARVVGIFEIHTSMFRTFDVAAQLPEKTDLFAGAATVGDSVAFAPNAASAVGVFDTVDWTFSTIDISAQTDQAIDFSGAAAVGRKVVFAPANTRVGVLAPAAPDGSISLFASFRAGSIGPKAAGTSLALLTFAAAALVLYFAAAARARRMPNRTIRIADTEADWDREPVLLEEAEEEDEGL